MRAALLASALAALAFGACAKPPATEVVLRLDAASFAIPGATRAVEPIGEEARPVVVAPTLGVRRGPRKIVRAGGRYEEFDLATDPLETRRLAVGDDSRAAVEQLMAAHLAAANEIRARTLPAPSADGSAPIPHRVEESLRALGYL